MAGRGAPAGTPTTYTIYGQTVDGLVRSHNTSYATAAAGSNLLGFPDSTGGTIGQLDFSGTFYIYETFLSFNTAAVAGAITSVTLSLYGQTNPGPTFTLEARLHDWGTTVDTADWVAGSSLAGKTLLASRSTVGLTTSGYNAFTSDAAFLSNVNQAGVTRLLVCSSLHRLGTQPPGDERAGFFLGAQTGTANDPKLVIDALV